MDSLISEPFECPAVYDWIQACLRTRGLKPFITLPELVATRLPSATSASNRDQWSQLTPRTLLFERLFSAMQSNWSAQQMVEELSSAGADQLVLDTLPEAVLAPLQEAIVKSQAEPPATWSKELLTLVGREDVGMLLTPGQRPRQVQSTLLVRNYICLGIHVWFENNAD